MYDLLKYESRREFDDENEEKKKIFTKIIRAINKD